MAGACYLNGEIFRADEPLLRVDDLGLQRGYAVFDYARTHGGRFFHLADHIARLRRSAAALRLELPHSDEEIARITEELVAASDLTRPAIRFLLTGGSAEEPPALSRPTFIAIAEELHLPPDELFVRGERVATHEFQRELPEVKSTNYIRAVSLTLLREEHGVDDFLYHWRGRVTEAPRNNFFLFRGDTLVTPDRDVLPGITRAIVMRLAREHFAVEEREVSTTELARADEAFLSSTTKEVMPVVVIDGRPVGDGAVGQRTLRLAELFREYVAG